MDRKEIYKTMYGQLDPDHRTPRIQRLLQFLSGRVYERVLDIGCGDGRLTSIFTGAVHAHEVKAIEISEEGTAKARAAGINCVRLDTDTDAFPFEQGAFDFVNCSEIIEHVFDTDRLLEFIHMALKPGGHALITTPNIASWHARVSLLLGYNPYKCSASIRYHHAGKLLKLSAYGGVEHIRYFSLNALKDIAHYHGFTVTRVFGFSSEIGGGTAKLVGAPVRILDGAFARIPSMASEIGIFCTKTGTPCSHGPHVS